MQQTEKYKLNLIEPTDPFLPDGINANMQKVEDVLSGALNPMQAMVDTFNARLGSHGHNARLAFGTRTGDGKYGQSNPVTFTFDFRPMLLIMADYIVVTPTVLARGCKSVAYNVQTPLTYVSWTENSVTLKSTAGPDAVFNADGKTYSYLAIGYDPEP